MFAFLLRATTNSRWLDGALRAVFVNEPAHAAPSSAAVASSSFRRCMTDSAPEPRPMERENARRRAHREHVFVRDSAPSPATRERHGVHQGLNTNSAPTATNPKPTK